MHEIAQAIDKLTIMLSVDAMAVVLVIAFAAYYIGRDKWH